MTFLNQVSNHKVLTDDKKKKKNLTAPYAQQLQLIKLARFPFGLPAEKTAMLGLHLPANLPKPH